MLKALVKAFLGSRVARRRELKVRDQNAVARQAPSRKKGCDAIDSLLSEAYSSVRAEPEWYAMRPFMLFSPPCC